MPWASLAQQPINELVREMPGISQMQAFEFDHRNVDVRMRGFAQRTTVDAALAWIDSVLSDSAAIDFEDVSLLSAAGRVLARDVVSPVNVPGFSRAMMD